MPGTTRTPVTDRAVQWDSSRTVARGVSTTVEERRAKALGVDKDKRRGGGSKSPKSDGPSETVGNIFGLLWIAFGALVIVLCAIFVIGSIIMFGVLHEISDARNFDAAASQTSAHEDFFVQAGEAGFKVANDKPNIKEGVTQYLWTVSPPNEGPMRVFSWQHDLENNEMRPTSNAAALLDIELGLLDEAKAQEYALHDGRRVFEFDPQDAVTKAIIDLNASAFAKTNGEGWGQPGSVLANAPPLPDPLFDTKAKYRKGVGAGAAAASDEEEVAEEENPTEGEAGEQTEDGAAPPAEDPQPEPEQPEPPVEVIPEPPAEDAGDGNADDEGGERFPPPPGDDEGDGDDDGEATPVG